MIVYDKGQHEQTIYGMWERNFHDPIPYARFYFENVYPKNQVILWQDNNIMKGMIHWNSYRQQFFGKEMQSTYIVGVATDEEYRREGVMRKLLGETFRELREKGQSFTYLMPADDAYYLPFDFRYGMSQIEGEIYVEDEIPLLLNWRFVGEQDCVEFLPEISKKENQCRNQLFDLHTKITPDYLKQLEEEAKGDFARLLYIFEGEDYVGRCVMGAEDSYMTLSQLQCVETKKQNKMLEQLLAYGESRYHYGAYKVIADCSWESVLKQLRTQKKYQMTPLKHVPIIMFRILDIQAFAKNIKAKEEKEIQLYIADVNLPVQSGRYIWKATKEGVFLRKYNGEDIVNGGKISIADLTDLLFKGGEKKKTLNDVGSLTEEGKLFMENLEPIGDVCITEIV